MKAILRSINNFSCKLKQSNNLKYNISPKIRSNKFKNISGDGNIVIEDAIKKDLKDYRVYGNTVQSKLPDGYTQVDYIESSETGSYINTNYYPTSDTTIELDYKFVRTTSSSTAIPILGERANLQSNFKFAIWVNSSSNRTALNFGNYDSGYVANSNPKVRNVITTDNSKLYYNGNLVASSDERTFSRSSLPIYLFGLNENNGLLHRNQVTQLYSLKIYEKNSLVRNFIPCYRNSDSEVGLYDLVNNVFYTNQGTGVFTYGSVAPTPDAPIEMVSCGDRTKNLLNASSTYTVERATIDFSLQPGTYIVSCESPENYRRLLFFRWQENTNDGNYVYIEANTTSTEFTITKEVSKLNFYSRDGSIASTGNTTTYKNLMIRKSNISDGTYEPYGKYKIPVNVRSENIYNIHGKSAGSSSVSSEVDIDDNDFISSSYDNINGSNTHYTNVMIQKSSLLQPSTNYLIVCEIESVSGTGSLYPFTRHNDSSIESWHTFYQFSNLSAGQKIIIPVTTKSTLSSQDLRTLVRFDVGQSGSIKFRLSILEDTTITEDTFKYQSYYNETTNIYLDEPLRKSDEGTYVDHIDFENKKVYRQIKEITLNGTEAWSRVSAKNSHYRFRVNRSDLKIGTECVLYCTHFKNNGDSYSFEGISGSTGHVLYIRWDELFETVDDLKTWLASNTPIVDYVLETPIEENIELPNINLIEGRNIITIG